MNSNEFDTQASELASPHTDSCPNEGWTHCKGQVSLCEEPEIHCLPVSPRIRRFPQNAQQVIEQELSDFLKYAWDPVEAQHELSLILADCAKANLCELAQHLLTVGYKGVLADANAPGYQGKTPLHCAVEAGHLAVCEVIVNYGRCHSLDVPDDLWQTPLHYACRLNCSAIVRFLVRVGASLNVQDSAGNSPIHYIVSNRNVDLFQFLLRRDADLRLTNNNGQTPVELAKFSSLDSQVCLLNVTPAAYRPASKVLHEEEVFDLSFSTPPRESLSQEEEDDDEEADLFDFEVIRPLKKVSFGEILYLVRNSKTDKLYAMKVIKKSKLQERNLFMKYAVTEREVMLAVKHPFVARLRHSYQSEGFLYLITDHCRGGDLARCIAKERVLREDNARLYAAEIVLALEALHECDIVYRNLKPKNVEIDEDGHVRLSNFGLAKTQVKSPTTANSFFLSYSHLPPEVLQSNGHGKAVDWYMLGVLLFEMLVGQLPFHHKDKNTMIRRIQTSLPEFPEGLSPAAQDFICQLLAKSPEQRLGFATGAAEVKQHAFFAGTDWDLVEQKLVVTPPVDFPDCSVCSVTDGFLSRDSSLLSPDSSHVQGWDFASPVN